MGKQQLQRVALWGSSTSSSMTYNNALAAPKQQQQQKLPHNSSLQGQGASRLLDLMRHLPNMHSSSMACSCAAIKQAGTLQQQQQYRKLVLQGASGTHISSDPA
jgi:hypothetical protein